MLDLINHCGVLASQLDAITGLAQIEAPPLVSIRDVVASLLYSVIGIVIFSLAFYIVDLLTPYDLWKELIEKKNLALALVVAGLGVGICIIIASSIH